VAVVLSSVVAVATTFATGDKSLTRHDEAAQVLADTKNALKDLKASGTVDKSIVNQLEKSIDRLEQLTEKLAEEPSLKKNKGLNLLLEDDFFNRSFDADKWNPLQEMQAMQNQMNQLFGEAFGRFDGSTNFNHLFNDKGFSPSINLAEDNKQFIVTVDLPGATKENVEIVLKDQLLTIKGSTIEEKEKKDEKNHMYRRERFSGKFERSLTLPAPVKAEGMVSNINNGVLEIKIPKA